MGSLVFYVHTFVYGSFLHSDERQHVARLHRPNAHYKSILIFEAVTVAYAFSTGVYLQGGIDLVIRGLYSCS